MSKKAYIIAAGCFIVGVLLGVVASTAYWGKQTMQGLALLKEMEIARYGERAFAAYQNESPQVAIYALSQYLDLLAETEALAVDQAVFMNPVFMRIHRRIGRHGGWQRARDSNPCTSLERAVS